MEGNTFIDIFTTAREQMNQAFEAYMDGLLHEQEARIRIVQEAIMMIGKLTPDEPQG